MAATSPRPKSAPRKDIPQVDSEDFKYTTKDGTDITLPRFDSVKPGVVRRIRKLSEVDQFFTVLEALSDPETLAVIDDLDREDFQDLQTEWFRHAGVDLGES